MSKHISKQSNKTKFEEMWTKAKVVTDEVVAVLIKPRTAAVSRFRNNAGVGSTDAESVETHY